MKREVALAVLKEIVEVYEIVGVNHISLQPVKESVGFERHIKDHFDEHSCERLNDVLQKHNLSMRKYDNTVVIYKPKHR